MLSIEVLSSVVYFSQQLTAMSNIKLTYTFSYVSVITDIFNVRQCCLMFLYHKCISKPKQHNKIIDSEPFTAYYFERFNETDNLFV